jgi:hypothetical protein
MHQLLMDDACTHGAAADANELMTMQHAWAA